MSESGLQATATRSAALPTVISIIMLDGQRLAIPNGDLATRAIVNITRRDFIRAQDLVHLEANTPAEKVREAVAMLDEMDVDFEYEGEMPPELALEPERRANYPFMRLTGPANVLVMPAIHSASISTRLIQALGGATVIGPLLVGLEKSVQIVPLGASVSEIITAATFAAYDAGPAFQGSGLTSAPRPPAAVVEKPSTAVPPTV